MYRLTRRQSIVSYSSLKPSRNLGFLALHIYYTFMYNQGLAMHHLYGSRTQRFC